MFVGRKTELKLLNDAYRSGKDELVVLYGRRRIGKSSLVKRFAEKKKSCFWMNCRGWPQAVSDLFHFSSTIGTTIGKTSMSC